MSENKRIKNTVKLRARQCAQALGKELTDEELKKQMSISYGFDTEVINDYANLFKLFYKAELSEMEATGNGRIGRYQ